MNYPANPYLELVLKTVPWVLSQWDRNCASSTYGSADRAHWAWANKDYANTDFQRAVSVLSGLYFTPFQNNAYYRNPELRSWIFAACEYWITIQHKNGSFDQWYPYECSAGTTGFTLVDIATAYELWQHEMPEDFRVKLKAAIWKAANFLLRAEESHHFISNHQAGIALALKKAARITSEDRFELGSRAVLNLILSKQSTEGWYSEYSGFDPGYETLGIHYLAQLYAVNKEPALLASLTRAVNHLRHFLHPDGSWGGEYGSRNTELYYPAGFELLRDEIVAAAEIADRLGASIVKGLVPTPINTDIYNCVPLLTSYFAASQSWRARNISFRYDESTLEMPFERFFGDCGVLVKRTRSYKLICSVRKGGVIKLFDAKSGKLTFSHCGFVADTAAQQFSNQFLSAEHHWQRQGGDLSIAAKFYRAPKKEMTLSKFAVFRMLTLFFGVSLPLNFLFKKLLAHVLISSRKPAGLVAHIALHYDESRVDVTFRMKDATKLAWTGLRSPAKFTPVFMGSANYFTPCDLEKRTMDFANLLPRLNDRREVVVQEARFDFTRAGGESVERLSSRARSDEPVSVNSPALSD